MSGNIAPDQIVRHALVQRLTKGRLVNKGGRGCEGGGRGWRGGRVRLSCGKALLLCPGVESKKKIKKGKFIPKLHKKK